MSGPFDKLPHTVLVYVELDDGRKLLNRERASSNEAARNLAHSILSRLEEFYPREKLLATIAREDVPLPDVVVASRAKAQ